MARILFKQSVVMMQQAKPDEKLEATRLANIADTLKVKLEREGTNRHENDDAEDAYDRLVCPFFR